MTKRLLVTRKEFKCILESFETWKGATPPKVTLAICANKQQRNARHRYQFARQSTNQIEMQILTLATFPVK